MVDSTQTEQAAGLESEDIDVRLAASDDGPIISYIPSAAFLESATYPVFMDPSVTFRSTGEVADAYVSSKYPDANYGDFQRADTGQHELKVGPDPWDPSGNPAANVREAFMRFDLSGISGKVVLSTHIDVDSMDFSYLPYYQYSGSAATDTWFDKLGSSATWSETGVTWNNSRDFAVAGTLRSATIQGSTEHVKTESFATWVQGWLDDPASNNGIRLHVGSNTTDPQYFKRIVSSEELAADGVSAGVDTPRLKVKWFESMNWVDADTGAVHLGADFYDDPAVVAERSLGYNPDGDQTIVTSDADSSLASSTSIVKVIDASLPAYRAVGRLHSTNTGWCTAWAIDQDTLITAAHCLYKREGIQVIRGYPRRWEPRRAVAGNGDAQYYCPTRASGFPQAWRDAVLENRVRKWADVAFVKFRKAECVGSLTIHTMNYEPGRSPVGGTLRNVGYPADGTQCPNGTIGFMATSLGSLLGGPYYYYYGTYAFADMTWAAGHCGGMSGGPAIRHLGDGRYVAFGVIGCTPPSGTCGPFITVSVGSLFKSWKDTAP
jgi:V8-like Glu-specific endopeptidase